VKARRSSSTGGVVETQFSRRAFRSGLGSAGVGATRVVGGGLAWEPLAGRHRQSNSEAGPPTRIVRTKDEFQLLLLLGD
jgi:hypothetical protein